MAEVNSTDLTVTDQLKDKEEADRKGCCPTAPIKAEFVANLDEIEAIITKAYGRRIVSGANLTDKDDDSVPKGGASAGDIPNKRNRGQNKNRPRDANVPETGRICPTILRAETCKFGSDCRFLHDLKSYWQSKPADLGSECPLYSSFCHCDYGIACRYARTHVIVDDDGQPHNIPTASSTIDKTAGHLGNPQEQNRLSFSVRNLLRKRTYDFDKSKERLKEMGAAFNDEKDNRRKRKLAEENRVAQATTEDTTETLIDSSNQTSDIADPQVNVASSNVASDTQLANKEHVSDDTVAIAEHKTSLLSGKRRLDFRGKKYLAPLTTVGNLPFRRICVEMGADITCGEMAVATQLLQGNPPEWALMQRHESEKMFGVQLCGAYPDTMTYAAQVVTENCNVDFMDINLGCPIDLICSKGAGCQLMRNTRRLEQICKCMSSVIGDIPLTVKMRTGLVAGKRCAHSIVEHLGDWGVSLFSLHGRTKEQRYTKLPDWNYINECAVIGNKTETPCFGCGDILTHEDYWDILDKQQAVNGIMIARGALIKPWIFTEIDERRHWDISSKERLDMLQKYVTYGLQHWGSDDLGVAKTRRFLLEWLSFTYRYIPVGLLERLPQKINERPPFYHGRDDLETLMASPNCADWVKISELLLGPVPDGFSFLPKHKANSFA